MTQPINANRLFLASCFALITTAFSFSIRAGILTQLGTELNWVKIPARILNEKAVVMRAKQLARNRRFALIDWVIAFCFGMSWVSGAMG